MFPSGAGLPVPVSSPSFLHHSYLLLTQSSEWAGVDLSEFPHLEKWLYKLLERPGFEAGRHVPTHHTAFEVSKLSEEELEKKAEASRGWVQAGMKVDAKK
jgi:glutathione S-transferase